MKEYKKRQRNDDLVQRVGVDTKFGIVDPMSEKARQDEDRAFELRSVEEQSAIPEDREGLDVDRLPQPQNEERVDHSTFITWLIALVALFALLAGVFIFGK